MKNIEKNTQTTELKNEELESLVGGNVGNQAFMDIINAGNYISHKIVDLGVLIINTINND